MPELSAKTTKVKTLLVFFSLLSFQVFGQLEFESTINLGTIPEASEIRGTVLIRNSGLAKIYLLRADAENGIKIYTSKKIINAGDTALLSISFMPKKAGKFEKKIALVSSNKPEASTITLSGNLQKFKQDDKTACFYFGEKRQPSSTPTQTLLAPASIESKPDLSNKIPDKATPSQSTILPGEAKESRPNKTPVIKDTSALPLDKYKPNNLIFLVDVSGSMKDSLKLPVMKQALHGLINELREVDKITFITYADTIKVLAESADAATAEKLHLLVDQLKAKGMTKGRKAILFSQQIAQKHFIPNGNNQIIIATDGMFKFEKQDQDLWNERQGEKPIIISTLCFGSDKDAVRNLKSLARKGKGNFIQILSKAESRQKLLEEIQNQSRREQR